MSTEAAADRSLITERLRTETRDLHTKAEKAPLQEALVKGKLPREVYADMLEQMLLVHRELEQAIREHRPSVPALAAVVTDEQFQEPYILEDLAHFGRDPGSITALPETREAVAEIRRTAREEPLGLLGLHYVLEGSNNGNRFIAKAAAPAMGLSESGGLRYLLPYGERQPEVWGAFKENLAACEFSDSEKDTLVEAAKRMFEIVFRVHSGLHRAKMAAG